MVKIFLTGASGYLGGEILHQVVTAHPDYACRILVRTPSKGEIIKQTYNQVEIVHGSLEDLEILEKEAAHADIVLHFAAMDHLLSTKAIHQALKTKSHSGKPLFFIQIGGSTNVASEELANEQFKPGEPSDVIFDDIDGLSDMIALIRRNTGDDVEVDKYLFDAVEQTPHVKIARLIGPIIYGEGRGVLNKRSIQIPDLALTILKRQKGLQVGRGHSKWGNVHVRDLSNLVLRLVDDAVANGGSEDAWNQNGIYLTDAGEELSFGEISRKIVDEAYRQGFLPSTDIDQVSGDEANELLPEGKALYGTNARGRSRRAKEVLGWNPSQESLATEIKRVVAQEQQRLSFN